jgi:hypothetical protein
MQRLRRGTTQAVVVLSPEIRGFTPAHGSHTAALSHLNEVLGGRVTYVLAPERPASGLFFEAIVDPADPLCGNRTLGLARLSYQGLEIVGGRLVYCRLDYVSTTLVTHELGHSLGLNHSPYIEDVMHRFIVGRTQFTRSESLSLSMLFERPAGNRYPDSDRGVAGAGSGSRTIVCN